MKAVYPVIFTKTDTCVLVEVPDLGILTEGEDMMDAIDMARDAIGLKGISIEDTSSEIPKASNLDEVDLSKGAFAGDGASFVSLVDIDFSEYRKKNDNKTVRRNVTLPNWLNQEADKAHVNVSRVLQEALMEKLGAVK